MSIGGKCTAWYEIDISSKIFEFNISKTNEWITYHETRNIWHLIVISFVNCKLKENSNIKSEMQQIYIQTAIGSNKKYKMFRAIKLKIVWHKIWFIEN